MPGSTYRRRSRMITGSGDNFLTFTSFDVELSMCRTKYIAMIVLALTANSLFAQSPQLPAGTVKRGKTIIVTNNIPFEKLPAAVKDMTPDEFKNWAINRNNLSYEVAKAKHDEYLATRDPLTTMDLTSSSASHVTRFGGGYGAGGFGGSGGYLGYNSPNVSYPYGYYPGSGTNGGIPGFGSGFTFNGNSIRTNDTAESQSWTKTFKDLNDAGGGPVMLINPFCFDYWRAHTE